jgi:surfeit locus 1 family protein
LVGHVVVLVLAALFIRLGFWQLSRFDEKRDRRDTASTRLSAAVADPNDLSPEEGEFRRVRVAGVYDRFHQVEVRNRTQSGIAGRWVLTPVVPDAGGNAVVVNRGFVPAREHVPPPPMGRVIVEGILLRSQTRGSFGPKDPETGTLSVLNRVDVARFDRQVPGDFYPLWLQLTAQTPPPIDLPLPLPPPEIGLGPHLPYAVQWFIFAAIGLIGWPILVRRRARASPID